MMRTPQEAAEWMFSNYKESSYSPEERATDHAFSYDSAEDAGRKYWLAVLQAMKNMNGVSCVPSHAA